MKTSESKHRCPVLSEKQQALIRHCILTGGHSGSLKVLVQVKISDFVCILIKKLKQFLKYYVCVRYFNYQRIPRWRADEVLEKRPNPTHRSGIRLLNSIKIKQPSSPKTFLFYIKTARSGQTLEQRFPTGGSRPTSGSRKGYKWVATRS